MNKSIFLCIIAASGLFLSSCGGKKQEGEKKDATEQMILDNPYYDSSMNRSAQDTASVIQLATQYLTFVKEKKFDEAIAMLHEKDSTNLKPLSDNRKKEILGNLNKFPVLSFTIEDFHLFSDQKSELHYVYEFMQKPEGSESFPNTMKGALGFIRVGSTWYLTIPENLVDPEINDMQNSKSIK